MDRGNSQEMEQEVKQHVAEVTASMEAEMEVHGDINEAPESWQPAKGKDPYSTVYDRRAFLRGGTALVGGLAMTFPLGEYMQREAYGAHVTSPYGQPVPTIDGATGLPLIALPPGFRYYSYGWTGDPIAPNLPGVLTPNLHDGMGALRQIGSRVVLCRNHETSFQPSFFGGPIEYSAQAGGGNTNLIFNTATEKWEKAWPSLSGTIRNCAGGTTPFASWLSCEETFSSSPNGQTHGWVFDVPAFGLKPAAPITDMGRFSHEAVAVDPTTGIVYETEDAGNSGFYRFTPNTFGNYAAGGTLDMLRIKGRNQLNLKGPNPRGGGGGLPLDDPALFGPNFQNKLDCEWVPILDPTASVMRCFDQGFAQGGCVFRRLEGAWPGNENMYFLSTDGGVSGEGTVFCFNVPNQTLEVIFDSANFVDADNPDNITVTPNGAFILCEDNSGSARFTLNGVSTERLKGLTRNGQTFDFAYNLVDFGTLGTYTRPNNPLTFTGNFRGAEWAGACFSPDGNWLFVNIQSPGITFAITGPWSNGPF